MSRLNHLHAAVGLLLVLSSAHADTTLTLETDVPRIIRRSQQARGTSITLPADVEMAIRKAVQGDVINMAGYDMEILPILPIQQQAGGPPMIFADDPEYIRVPEAAVLREVLNPGVNRFYLYECNGTSIPKTKISPVIENLGDQPMHLRFLRSVSPRVTLDYGRAGKEAIREFITAKPLGAVRTIPARGSDVFDTTCETALVAPDELMHGWYEFEIDQPARITVLQTAPDVPSVIANARIAELLPPRSHSGAGRGYYSYSEYVVTQPKNTVLDTAEGPHQIFLADGTLDRWLTGWDSTTSQPVQLTGNYGVIYHIQLKRQSSDGKALALLTWNARTKSGCGAMSGCTAVSAGKFAAGPVMVPGKEPVLRGGDKAVLLQVYPPPAKGTTDEIEITYTPPGASCLPTPLLLVPISD
ncbi:MAG: copper amine oxidase [Candidatus Sumerlaeaceae bacterium]